MKILVINGSQRLNGNSSKAATICAKYMKDENEIEVINLAEYYFSGCVACEGCNKSHRCVIADDMQLIYPKIEKADGVVLISPTYFYNISSKMKAFIERLYPYVIFNKNSRDVWLGLPEVFGLKYAVVIGICEQENEADMGYTIEAMSLPIKSLGYRVVEEVKLLNLFNKNDISSDEEAIYKINKGVEKLYKTIELKDSIRRQMK